MEQFNYSLEIESNPEFKVTEPKEPTFSHNASISDEDDDQMIKISARMVCKKEGRDFTIKTIFYYKVPYGQNIINLDNIVDKLVYQSFIHQKNFLKTNVPDAIVPDIPFHHNL